MTSNKNTQMNLLSWLAGVPAKHSASADSEKDSKTQEETSCSNTLELSQQFNQHILSGKMYQVSFPQTTEKTLEPYSKQWLNSGILSAGELWTAKTSESHNDAEESFLSDILETKNVHSKFYLSQKACIGLIRRANKRGKTIPPKLLQALQNTANQSLKSK